jgi:hypothetical protein
LVRGCGREGAKQLPSQAFVFLRGAACFLLATANARDSGLLWRSGASLTRLPVRLFSRYEVSSSLVRQLRTLFFGTPPLRAISTPQCVRSSFAGGMGVGVDAHETAELQG